MSRGSRALSRHVTPVDQNDEPAPRVPPRPRATPDRGSADLGSRPGVVDHEGGAVVAPEIRDPTASRRRRSTTVRPSDANHIGTAWIGAAGLGRAEDADQSGGEQLADERSARMSSAREEVTSGGLCFVLHRRLVDSRPPACSFVAGRVEDIDSLSSARPCATATEVDDRGDDLRPCAAGIADERHDRLCAAPAR